MAKLTRPVLAVALAVVASLSIQALAVDRVSGTLTSTYVIVEDTELAGDVTCNVGSTPCFSFGTAGVVLRLNGYSITGRADPNTGCAGASFANEFGIIVNNQHNVAVQGPGIVQRFRNHGVFVTGGARNTRIEGITVSTNCTSGIRVADAFDTVVQGNTATRNGNGTQPCGGI
jgi:parallel beta-helix repeat protein